MHIALSYKHTPRMEVAYTNCLIGSLNISVGKILVPSSSVLFAYPSIGRKPYYSGGLSLNRSIDLTSIGL